MNTNATSIDTTQLAAALDRLTAGALHARCIDGEMRIDDAEPCIPFADRAPIVWGANAELHEDDFSVLALTVEFRDGTGAAIYLDRGSNPPFPATVMELAPADWASTFGRA
jgi:hypothetical protein